MGHITNHDIVPAALKGLDRSTPNGNFSTVNVKGEFLSSWTGWLSNRLTRIRMDRHRAGEISQIIYSYATPIAWKDGDAWIIPDVTYSRTTSSKHATHLYRLPNRKNIPWDAGMDEYLSVIEGRAVYIRGYGDKVGTYRAAA